MLYDCKPNIQSQKRCTMDSLKETDKPAPNPSKHPRIEVDEELMRQMIAGQAPLDSKVVRRIPEPEEEDTDTPEGIRISNACSSLRWIAVIALRSMSVPKPSAKCRQSSTCWETIRQGLRHWPTICCGSSWTFTATS